MDHNTFQPATDSRQGPVDAASRRSPVPILGEGFTEAGNTPTRQGLPSPPNEGSDVTMTDVAEIDPKTGKRRFRNLNSERLSEARQGNAPTELKSSKTPQLQQAFAPASPRQPLRSSSPQMLSPASSSIFERNVQEDVAAISPAMPSHIATENYIPPVLDASSKAITDTHLDPDSVEIVTHAAHQPAAVTIASPSSSNLHHAGSDVPPISPYSDDSASGVGIAAPGANASLMAPLSSSALAGAHGEPEKEDNASTYGELDTADVRRLSFISFADVVHAEHAASNDHGSIRDSMLFSPPPSSGSPLAVGAGRSPSPVRSPISPPLSASMSGSPRLQGLDGSPGRINTAVHTALSNVTGASSGKSVPVSSSSPPPPSQVNGELAIETMTQALRKTASGDLSVGRTMSAGSGEDLA